MQWCKVQLETGEVRVGVFADGHVRLLDLQGYGGLRALCDILHSENPRGVAHDLIDDRERTLSLSDVTLLPPIDQQEVTIRLRLDRIGKTVFDGASKLAEMTRSLEDLIGWLGKDNSFPNGVILLTGTGIVPPDDFSLAANDVVSIEISGIGTLVNRV